MSSGKASMAVRASVRARPQGWRARYQPDHRRTWYWFIAGSPAAVGSIVLLLIVTAGSLLAPLITSNDPEFINPSERLQAPSWEHLLGTDDLGRDVYSRLVYGGRVSLLIGAVVTALSAVVGTAFGLIAGYYRRLDGVIMRLMDAFMAFPGILLAIAIVISLGPRQSSVILALTLVYVPVVARLVRSMTLVTRELPYVEAARAMGLPDGVILRRYIFANSVSPLIVQATFIAAYAILAEASLSFLGASVDPETATWGNMLRNGQRLLSRAWWMAVPPGTILFLTVLACTLLGDGLRDAFDPRTREHRSDPLVG